MMVTPSDGARIGGSDGNEGPLTAGVPTSEVVVSQRKLSAAWLVPLMVLVMACVLVYQAVATRGPRVLVLFESGNGIQPNDPVTYRGVRVGTVRSVSLGSGSPPIRVEIALNSDAAVLAREGTAFWIVRPELTLTKVTGLETLFGPRYIVAEPGKGEGKQRFMGVFIGLDHPPRGGHPSEMSGRPDLELKLRADRLGSVREGAPVTYRELPVGSVTVVELSRDARRIDITVRIQSEYAHLVRENTRFWNVSGIGLDLGLMGGLKLKAQSLQTVLAGGVAFATPNSPGPVVSNGRTFELEPDVTEEFLRWSPDLTAVHVELPADIETAPRGR